MLNSDGGNFVTKLLQNILVKAFLHILPQFNTTQHAQNGQPPIAIFIIKKRVVHSAKGTTHIPTQCFVAAQWEQVYNHIIPDMAPCHTFAPLFACSLITAETMSAEVIRETMRLGIKPQNGRMKQD
jgi:hypothetical protein